MKVKIDMGQAVKAYAAGIDYMSRLTGLPREQIITAEAGIILKACAARTPVMKVEQAEKGGQLRGLRRLKMTGGGPISVNAGIKKSAPFGRVFVRNRVSKKYFRTHDMNFQTLKPRYMGWNWLQDQVAEAKKAVQFGVAEVMKARGLARGSWVQIADSLGIDLAQVKGGGRLSGAAVAEARAARGRHGKGVANGVSRKEQSQTRFFITIINRLPFGKRIGLDSLLAVVIKGRVKYFQTSVEKGFIGSLAQVQKRFKGWTTNVVTTRR